MNRIVIFFGAKGFSILLFHVGILLFNWPILSLPVGASEGSIFSYLIVAWTVIVILLIVVSRSILASEDKNEEA